MCFFISWEKKNVVNIIDEFSLVDIIVEVGIRSATFQDPIRLGEDFWRTKKTLIWGMDGWFLPAGAVKDGWFFPLLLWRTDDFPALAFDLACVGLERLEDVRLFSSGGRWQVLSQEPCCWALAKGLIRGSCPEGHIVIYVIDFLSPHI